jgi:hypothetical protein
LAAAEDWLGLRYDRSNEMAAMTAARAGKFALIYLIVGVVLFGGVLYLYPPRDGSSFDEYVRYLGGIRFVVLGIGFALLILGPVGLLAQWSARRRGRKVTIAARQMGLSRIPDEEKLADPAFLALPVFRERFYSSVDEVMHGHVLEGEVVLCRHSPSDPDSVNRYQTVACFKLRREQPLPDFILRPQTIWGAVASAWRDDIKFESHAEFSDAYRLRGQDEAALRSLMRPPLLDLLQKDQRWCVESGTGWVALYKSGDEVALKDLPGFLEAARQIVRLLSGP